MCQEACYPVGRVEKYSALEHPRMRYHLAPLCGDTSNEDYPSPATTTSCHHRLARRESHPAIHIPHHSTQITTNSRKCPRRGSTKRRKASAIERAVNAVAVATTSDLLARPQRWRNCRANSRPNSSRPAVFGGFRRKNGRRRRSVTTGSTRSSAGRNPMARRRDITLRCSG